MPDDITPKVLLDHMQGMQQGLTQEIRRVEEKLTGEIGSLKQQVDANEEKAEQRHALVMVSLNNIDERLDEIETKELPMIKKVIGIA